MIHRPDLHAVLLEACAAQPAVGLHTHARVERFTQDANGVTATLADGSRFSGAALIGADGLWSAVRQAIVGDGAPRVSGHIAYRAVLPASEVPKHLRSPDVVLWGGEKTHLVHYPLRRGELYNLVAVFHSNQYEEGWNVFGDPHELHERFADAVGPVRELLGKIDTWKMWVLCDREPVQNWSQGRVTLLGDAAHPMLQYLAQGACMAIEDAVVLGAALRRADGDFAAAFQALPARALPAHRARAADRALLRRHLPRVGRHARIAQPAVPVRRRERRLHRPAVAVPGCRPGNGVRLILAPETAVTAPADTRARLYADMDPAQPHAAVGVAAHAGADAAALAAACRRCGATTRCGRS